MLRPPPGKFVGTPINKVGAEHNGNLYRLILTEHEKELLRLRHLLVEAGIAGAGGTTIISSGGGSTTTTTELDVYTWQANGPYTVDTEVDGSIAVVRTGTITAVWLTRNTPGSSGSTVLDLNRNGTTLYTTQANRPTITYNDPDEKVVATLPDIVSLSMGDLLTVDTDTIESGTPEHWTLEVQVEPA